MQLIFVLFWCHILDSQKVYHSWCYQLQREKAPTSKEIQYASTHACDLIMPGIISIYRIWIHSTCDHPTGLTQQLQHAVNYSATWKIYLYSLSIVHASCLTLPDQNCENLSCSAPPTIHQCLQASAVKQLFHN